MMGLWVKLRRQIYLHCGLSLFASWELNGISLGLKGFAREMKRVIIKGMYERAETEACRRLVEPGDLILDCGGAIGYIGLFCLEQLRASRVVSVEANPHSIKLLRRNYLAHSRTPEVIQAAIVKADGPVTFHTGSEFWKDGVVARDDRQRAITVRGISLPRLFAELDFAPNVLLMDIEGAEIDLEWESLPETIVRIIIELHPRLKGPLQSYSLLKKIMDLGFDVVFAQEDVLGLQRRAAH